MGILFLLITGRVLDAQYKDSPEAIFMAYHYPVSRYH